MNVFDEETARQFLKIMAKMLQQHSEIPDLNATFPNTKYIWSWGGHKEKQLFFTGLVVLSVDEKLSVEIYEGLKQFAKLKGFRVDYGR